MAHYIIKNVQFSTTATTKKTQKETGKYKHTPDMHMQEKEPSIDTVPEEAKILYLLPKYQYFKSAIIMFSNK